MGGKSTICRQVCLTVLLAQVGFWVPAKEMEFTPVDAIFTRVGAQDRYRILSTFLCVVSRDESSL